MNIANQLTLARLGLTLSLVLCHQLDSATARWLAAGCLTLAVLTDWLDGNWARNRKQVTDFGKLMDPLADKVLMTAGFVLLTEAKLIPGWVTVLMVVRELLVMGLRQLAVSRQMEVAVDPLGKLKTVFQMGTLLFYYWGLAAHGNGWQPTGAARLMGETLIWSSVILTLVSGLRYGWTLRGVLDELEQRNEPRET